MQSPQYPPASAVLAARYIGRSQMRILRGLIILL